ncbi:hypothetical protein PACTADRAFT_47700 [Pachysolen tannophilus NRRL Y-2460]|uniref:Ureidoglycolate lyase n=1 Tax=Pachysolen tannophilus NRRL Y-2460 TaxID=669874 RepID=A0A1E4U1I7_PACTA|nr:hypothetical protein PACTADRAFT_47700 [Pachysolen tannophilus NRRL Y-2460]
MVLKTYQIDEASFGTIKAEPLTPESFADFGGIISPDHQVSCNSNQQAANYGTATKILKVAPIINNYSNAPSHLPATANWNIFRCSPPNHLIEYGKEKRENIYRSKVLERHPFSTQAFVPIGKDKSCIGYLVIVAKSLEEDEQKLPDLSTMKAFLCKGNQAVTYGVGTWHAPMIALEDTLDFGVLIHENGVQDEDCQECYLEPCIKIEFSL